MGLLSTTQGILSRTVARVTEMLGLSAGPKLSVGALQAAIDLRVDTFVSAQIAPRQTLFASNRGGRYWQGIVTTANAALPNNRDADALPVEMVPTLTGRPTDQTERWTDIGITLGATVPASVQIDVYDGPDGKGYTVTTRFRHSNVIYARVRNFGPETYREQPWQVELQEA